jgi:hypothetical protein
LQSCIDPGRAPSPLITARAVGGFCLITQESFFLDFSQMYCTPETNLTDPTFLQDFVAATAGIETDAKEQMTSIAVDSLRRIATL